MSDSAQFNSQSVEWFPLVDHLYKVGGFEWYQRWATQTCFTVPNYKGSRTRRQQFSRSLS